MRFPGSVRFFFLLVVIALASCSKDVRGVTDPVETDSAAVINKPLPSLDAGTAISFSDLAYGIAPQQKLDLSLVAGRNTSTAFVILLHGGAWSAGDKKDLSGEARYFVSQGINVASVNYRLTSSSAASVRWPGILSDVNAAITYLSIHSDSLRTRDAGFVIFGLSAGAHLALLHSYSYDGDKLIAAVIGFGTPTKLNDPAWKKAPFLEVAEEALPPLTGQSFATDTANTTLEELSPYFGKDLKPTLLIHGDQDNIVPYSQSVLMHNELQTAGVASDFISLPHSGHSGEGASQTDLNNLLIRCSGWIKTYSD